MSEQASVAEMNSVAADLARYVPHTFALVTALEDGTPIPPEILSDDHSIGLYRDMIPRKMRESITGFREIEVSQLLPQRALSDTATGARVEWFLEYPPLRDVRFRTERLQYLEQGWWATTSEVKYPAATVLAIMYVIRERYGQAVLCINSALPMPIWVRPAPLGQPADGVEVVVQARGESRTLYTNIHSECNLESARRYVEWVRGYYRVAEGE